LEHVAEEDEYFGLGSGNAGGAHIESFKDPRFLNPLAAAALNLPSSVPSPQGKQHLASPQGIDHGS